MTKFKTVFENKPDKKNISAVCHHLPSISAIFVLFGVMDILHLNGGSVV
jgi:hypothetical protein